MSEPKELQVIEAQEVSEKEQKIAQAVDKLDKRELEAFTYFCDSNLPTVANSTAAKMFELYLNGKTCEEIRKLVPGFTLGQIVHAKVLGEWDVLVDEHRNRLLDTVKGRVQQVQMEAINHIADLISATHKLNGDKIKRFLLTGDENELKDVGLNNSYKQSLELLLKLTGQDVKRVKGEHVVTHNGLPTPDASKAPSQQEASDLLALIAGKK